MEMEKEDKRALLEIAKEKVLDHLDKARRQGLRRHRVFAQDRKIYFCKLHNSRKKNSE